MKIRFPILAMLAFLSGSLWAQSTFQVCPTATASATGRLLLLGPAGSGAAINRDPLLSATARITYTTTGSPISVGSQIEDGNDPAATITPYVRASSLTNTTNGDFGFIPLSSKYLYANVTALSASAKIIYTVCLSNVPIAKALSGSTTSGFTLGSVIFAGSGGVLTQDNTNLFYNNTTKGLQIKSPGVFTNTQQNNASFSNVNGINFGTEFSLNQGGTNFATEGFAAGVVGPVTSSVYAINGISGYAVAQGTTTNHIGIFGSCRTAVASGKCWAGNVVNSDTAGTAGVLNGFEIDTNILNAATTASGLSINGAWTAQSAGANALTIQKPTGGNFFWTGGIVIAQGATNSGTPAINLAPIASGVNQQSQELTFVSNDPTSGTHSATLKNSATGVLTSSANTTAPQVFGTANGNATGAAFVATSAGQTAYAMNATGEAADTKKWDCIAGLVAGQMRCRVINDAEGAAQDWMEVNRSGATVTNIAFPNGTVIMSNGLTVAGPVSSQTTNTALTVQAGVDAATAGGTGNLTLRGEDVTAGGTNNLTGGDVILRSGITTGTGAVTHAKIQSPALGLASANTQNTMVTRYVTHVKAGSTTSATPTTIFNIASATNSTWNLEILVGVQLISSTPNVCGTTERFSLTGTNNNGAFGTVNIVAGTTSTLCSTGTLTLAVTATAANPSVISVTPTWGTITSITSATITVQIQNVSQQEITLL